MKILNGLGLICLTLVLLCALGNSGVYAETLKSGVNEVAQAPVKYHVGKMALIPFTSKEKLATQQSDDSLNQIERYLTISLYDALLAQTDAMPDIELLPLKKSDTEYVKFRSGKPKMNSPKPSMEACT